jgi:hypothetical protein
MKFVIPIFFLISGCLGALEFDPDFNEAEHNINWVKEFPKLRAKKIE